MDIQKLVYDSHNGDSKMNCRTGQEVQIIRELTEKEADIEDVGRMFRVRFPDGYVTLTACLKRTVTAMYSMPVLPLPS